MSEPPRNVLIYGRSGTGRAAAVEGCLASIGAEGLVALPIESFRDASARPGDPPAEAVRDILAASFRGGARPGGPSAEVLRERISELLPEGAVARRTFREVVALVGATRSPAGISSADVEHVQRKLEFRRRLLAGPGEMIAWTGRWLARRGHRAAWVIHVLSVLPGNATPSTSHWLHRAFERILTAPPPRLPLVLVADLASGEWVRAAFRSHLGEVVLTRPRASRGIPLDALALTGAIRRLEKPALGLASLPGSWDLDAGRANLRRACVDGERSGGAASGLDASTREWIERLYDHEVPFLAPDQRDALHRIGVLSTAERERGHMAWDPKDTEAQLLEAGYLGWLVRVGPDIAQGQGPEDVSHLLEAVAGAGPLGLLLHAARRSPGDARSPWWVWDPRTGEALAAADALQKLAKRRWLTVRCVVADAPLLDRLCPPWIIEDLKVLRSPGEPHLEVTLGLLAGSEARPPPHPRTVQVPLSHRLGIAFLCLLHRARGFQPGLGTHDLQAAVQLCHPDEDRFPALQQLPQLVGQAAAAFGDVPEAAAHFVSGDKDACYGLSCVRCSPSTPRVSRVLAALAGVDSPEDGARYFDLDGLFAAMGELRAPAGHAEYETEQTQKDVRVQIHVGAFRLRASFRGSLRGKGEARSGGVPSALAEFASALGVPMANLRPLNAGSSRGEPAAPGS